MFKLAPQDAQLISYFYFYYQSYQTSQLLSSLDPLTLTVTPKACFSVATVYKKIEFFQNIMYMHEVINVRLYLSKYVNLYVFVYVCVYMYGLMQIGMYECTYVSMYSCICVKLSLNACIYSMYAPLQFLGALVPFLSPRKK